MACCLPCLPCLFPCCAAGWCGWKTSKLVEPKKPAEPVESALSTELKLRLGVRSAAAPAAAAATRQRLPPVAAGCMRAGPLLGWACLAALGALLLLGCRAHLSCPLVRCPQLHKAKGGSSSQQAEAPNGKPAR